jgi:16S rRNA (cytosine1402-N4)-methyltransferase
VLLPETLVALAPRPGARFLDGTFGGGGHSRALLAATAPNGVVLALDADADAIARGRALAGEPATSERLRLVQANFAELAAVAGREGLTPLDGVLLDLGLSSFQLADAERGFAFRSSGPLDMRFDRARGAPAAELVNALAPDALTDLLYRYGEEPKARRIAQAIVAERAKARITDTTRLAEIIESAVGGRRGNHLHPATRTFQALRIVTNDELDALRQALTGAVDVLAPGGRLVMIAFHSLEDRIVKHFLREQSVECVCPPRQPVCTCDQRPRLRLVGRAVRPSPAEVAANPRSRSAILRVAERLPDSPTEGSSR